MFYLKFFFLQRTNHLHTGAKLGMAVKTKGIGTVNGTRRVTVNGTRISIQNAPAEENGDTGPFFTVFEFRFYGSVLSSMATEKAFIVYIRIESSANLY